MESTKIVRNLFAVLLAFCCIASAIKPVSATTAEPRIGSSSNASTTLNIVSNSASCSVYVTAKSSTYEVTANMALYCTDENPFEPLKTWLIIGTCSISATETWYVSRGHNYQVIADITVKTSSGKLVESFTVNSPVVHY